MKKILGLSAMSLVLLTTQVLPSAIPVPPPVVSGFPVISPSPSAPVQESWHAREERLKRERKEWETQNPGQKWEDYIKQQKEQWKKENPGHHYGWGKKKGKHKGKRKHPRAIPATPPSAQ